MIGNFDTALTSFQADVHNGKANVRVVARSGVAGKGGGGALGLAELTALSVLVGAAAARRARAGRRVA
jgi:hypothetical protein